MAGPSLQFSVRDDGMGIPAGMLDAVFERFWQVGKRDKRGLGLSLYISKCLVDSHGGDITVHSVVGEGITFSFSIPVLARLAPGASRL